jgi:hemoglobin-like flavoprotein
MGESPEIRAFFHHKDIGDIHRKLKMTLEMLADSAEGQPGLSLYLEMLGRTHARLAIRPEHFARWREALVTTAAECDPELDAATRCAWGRIIDDLIAQLSTASEHAQGES